LNHAAHTRSNLLVILNDNNMSISNNVGGLANYFARIWASKTYIALREGGKKVLSAMPAAWEFMRRTEESMKNMVSPDALFEAIGIIDKLGGTQLLHIYTAKDNGFLPSEKDPHGYHAINKIKPKPNVEVAAPKKASAPKSQDVFGEWLCDMAAQDKRLVAI